MNTKWTIQEFCDLYQILTYMEAAGINTNDADMQYWSERAKELNNKVQGILNEALGHRNNIDKTEE